MGIFKFKKDWPLKGAKNKGKGKPKNKFKSKTRKKHVIDESSSSSSSEEEEQIEVKEPCTSCKTLTEFGCNYDDCDSGPICKNCMKECKFCDDKYCLKCFIRCSHLECKKTSCKNCIIGCEDCVVGEEYICPDHSIECSNCSAIRCDEHCHYCPTCDTSKCEDCITVGNGCKCI
jgi:hypothetical protein